ncbi:MAG TPA: PH domain-containing protein [Candidatus Eisenbacteria bacterium]|nr:PH domain-containing protein [Candidatus Eisenbacteria bacterium]
MVYPARREPILVWVLAFDGVITLGVASWMIWEAAVKHWSPAFFAVGPGLLFSFLAACWMLLHSNYEIAGQDLIVRQGPARRTISIAMIDEVFPTEKSALAPAWARDRLQVLFVPGVPAQRLFLDPLDREAFLQGLAAADPGLTYDGQKVARGGPI